MNSIKSNQLVSSRKSPNGTPTETEKFKLKFNALDSEDDLFPNQRHRTRINLTNAPRELISNLWKKFAQKILFNNKRIKLMKECEDLHKKIEQFYNNNQIMSRNQNSPSRKNKQIYKQAYESPTRTNNVQITTISTSRRSNSVQTQRNQRRQVNINIKRSNEQQKSKIKKLWETLSENLRRSKQRIILFHDARKIQLRRHWRSLIITANREKRIFDLKVQIFRVAVLIINQIFTNNRIQQIPASYVSKPLLFKLRSFSITTVLTELLQLYYNRKSCKERGSSLSISLPFSRIPIERDTIISNSKMFDLIHRAFQNSKIKIIENDVDDQTAEELIPVIDFGNETKIVGGNPNNILSNLIRLTKRDIRLVVNDRIVSDIMQELYGQINYPITSNVADEAAIRSIISNLTIEDSLPIVSQPNIDSIFDITAKDEKIYVNQRIIDEEIYNIISEIHFPIQLNIVDDTTAREIVEEDVFDDVIESEFSIPYVNNNFEYKDNKASLIKMLNYTPVDVRMHFSGGFVDDMIESLYNQISSEIPIISNKPTEQTCREIVDIDEYTDLPYGDYIEDKNEVKSWVDPVDRYQQKDLKFYVNERIIGRLVGQLFSQIKESLPIAPNTINQDDIDQILSIPIEDSLTTLPICKNKSIQNYKARDIQFYVNNRVSDNLLNNIYTSIPFPIVPNKVTKKHVEEILEDDFIDVYDIYSKVDEWIEPLTNVDPNNRTIAVDDRVVSKALKGLKMKVLSKIPIIPNTVDDETAFEIIDCNDLNCTEFEENCIQSIDPLVDVSNLLNMEATDIRMYVNERIIDNIVSTIVEETEIPIARNDVDESVIKEIANDGIEDVFGDLQLDFSTPIENYKPKDIQLYVNDRVIGNCMGRVFDSVDLPLVDNQVTDKDIAEILDDEDFGDGVPPIPKKNIEESLIPLYINLDPCERKINYSDFPISAGKFAREVLLNLPLCSNDVTESEIESILTYLDDKTTFKKSDNDDDLSLSSTLPLGNADSLKRYVAPVEVFESVDDVVERLLNRILVGDIFPAIPVERQAFVDNQTANAILSKLSKKQPNSVLIDEKSIFNMLITKPKSVIDIEPLKDFDIPEAPVSPDDFLNGILWHDVLTMLPIVPKKKKLIDFHDVVDEIVLDNYVDRDIERASNDSDNKSSRSAKSNKSNKSNKSAAADLICRLLTDSSGSYEIEENLPYLMTSPSNPPSPTTNSPHEKTKQLDLHQEEEQQYIKSCFDTSSESLSYIADENNSQNIKTKKDLKISKNIFGEKENKIVVNVEDNEYDNNTSFSFEGSANTNVKMENIVIEEEEEECEIVGDLLQDEIEEEKIEKVETKVVLSDDFEEDSDIETKKVESKIIITKTNNVVENILIIEEEEEETGDSIDIDIDFDVDATGDENKIKFSSIIINEEEDKLSDLLSDEFSD